MLHFNIYLHWHGSAPTEEYYELPFLSGVYITPSYLYETNASHTIETMMLTTMLDSWLCLILEATLWPTEPESGVLRHPRL